MCGIGHVIPQPSMVSSTSLRSRGGIWCRGVSSCVGRFPLSRKSLWLRVPATATAFFYCNVLVWEGVWNRRMLEYHRRVIRRNGPEVKMIFSATWHSRFPSSFLQGLHQAFCIDGTVREFHWILDRAVELWERWGEVVVAQHVCPRGCGLRVEVQTGARRRPDGQPRRRRGRRPRRRNHPRRGGQE